MTNPANNPSPAGLAFLSRAKLLGRIGGILFLLALVSIGDAVQATVRTPFNSIQLVAGKSTSISGILPQEASEAGEMIFFLKGPSAMDLSFSPTGAFRGFWLGGDMWRGTISAKPEANTGVVVLTIVDMVPAKKKGEAVSENEKPVLVQNPGLVYTVHLWSSQKEADQASLSFITRTTGFRTPILAVLSFLLALGASIFSFLTMRKAEARLAQEKTFIIHGSRLQPHGLTVFFTIPRGMILPTDATPRASLLNSDGASLAEGDFIETIKGKGTVLFSNYLEPPRYGWLITLH
ncbi:hypothetical protein LJC24_00390 [Desulfococcaceae bacterium OttesenSCG-928-F15]|nr:hypothetical protein [Desulfococcaceae bacterium OttesenSCG-928-F15]